MRTRALPSLIVLAAIAPATAQELPGTKPWPDRGDPASTMVEGLHKFADRLTLESVVRRQEHWKVDRSSPEAYVRSIAPNRERFAKIIGSTRPAGAPTTLSFVSTPDSPAKVAEGSGVSVYAVRWEVYPGFEAEGLWLEPAGEIKASVVAIPDAASSPEVLAGMADGPGHNIALFLARSHCRVLIPTLLDRSDEFSGNPAVRMTNLSHREWVYRMAYEAGRHVIGYEVDEVKAAVDWLAKKGPKEGKIGVFGHGEGGRIALAAAAVDPRIDVTWIAGSFGPRERVWSEPIDRNVWGVLDEFGDAEVVALIAPRKLVVQTCDVPEVAGPPPPRGGRDIASPGRVKTPLASDVQLEFDRIGQYVGTDLQRSEFELHESGDHLPPIDVLISFLSKLDKLEPGPFKPVPPDPTLRDLRPAFDPRARMKRLVDGMVAYTQGLIRTSEMRRYAYWSKADRSSPEAWSRSVAPLREAFHSELIGKLPEPSEKPEARTVKIMETPLWVGYGVEIPVYPDVVASGILLLPKDLQPGERRPVVVCQHGLEGRPESICDPKDQTVYRWFGATLADRGYIVYAPQNPYIGKERFRSLQRKLNPLKLSLFSVIVRQHEQTLRWLASRPEVDAGRIAFYGLSYGGKTAMRVPPILPGYCLSICSADFNEWAVKTTSIDRAESYMFTFEHDMYEFGLAERFNYAEMAALIAPRPFLVERGHFDTVAPDEWIGYEFAKVKRTYDLLGLSDRVGISYFNDGHRIDGGGTFPFLAEHLKWPRGLKAPGEPTGK